MSNSSPDAGGFSVQLQLEQILDDFEKLCRSRELPSIAAFFALHQNASPQIERELLLIAKQYQIDPSAIPRTVKASPQGAATALSRNDLAQETAIIQTPVGSRGNSASGGQATGQTATGNSNSATYPFLAPPERQSELGRLGGYSILQELGAGGMGIVFLGEDLQLRRQIAIKVLRPQVASISGAKERFLREARMMAAVNNDFVVDVYFVGEDAGVPFLTMPLLKGASLDKLLRKHNVIPEAVALRIAHQVCQGLAASHDKGLIHRDIKPANIWMETNKSWRVKLLDFGLARIEEGDASLTESGAFLGTPFYMAPEQAAGEDIDPRADLFSVGVVLYELLTGKRPFAGPNTLSVLTKLATLSPDPPIALNGRVSPEVSQLVMTLLEKNRERRPTSALETAKQIAQLLQNLKKQGTSSPDGARSNLAPLPNAPSDAAIPQALLNTQHFGVEPTLALASAPQVDPFSLPSAPSLDSTTTFGGAKLQTAPLWIAGAATLLALIVAPIAFIFLSPLVFPPKPKNSGASDQLAKQSENSSSQKVNADSDSSKEDQGQSKASESSATKADGASSSSASSAEGDPLDLVAFEALRRSQPNLLWTFRGGPPDAQWERTLKSADPMLAQPWRLVRVTNDSDKPYAPVAPDLWKCLLSCRQMEECCFIEEKWATDPNTQEMKAVLNDWPRMKRVSLHSDRLEDAIWKEVALLSHLESLKLRAPALSAKGLKELAKCPRLTSLSLGELRDSSSDLAEGLQVIPALRELDLSATKIEESLLRKMALLSKVESIRVASGPGISSQSGEAIANFEALERLTLDFHTPGNITGNEIEAFCDPVLRKHPALELHFDGLSKVGNGLQAALEQLKAVKKLRIGIAMTDLAEIEKARRAIPGASICFEGLKGKIYPPFSSEGDSSKTAKAAGTSSKPAARKVTARVAAPQAPLAEAMAGKNKLSVLLLGPADPEQFSTRLITTSGSVGASGTYSPPNVVLGILVTGPTKSSSELYAISAKYRLRDLAGNMQQSTMDERFINIYPISGGGMFPLCVYVPIKPGRVEIESLEGTLVSQSQKRAGAELSEADLKKGLARSSGGFRFQVESIEHSGGDRVVTVAVSEPDAPAMSMKEMLQASRRQLEVRVVDSKGQSYTAKSMNPVGASSGVPFQSEFRFGGTWSTTGQGNTTFSKTQNAPNRFTCNFDSIPPNTDITKVEFSVYTPLGEPKFTPFEFKNILVLE